SSGPIPVGLDPFGTLRWWAGQREVEDVRHAQHLGLERQQEMFFHHGEQPAALLGIAVGIDRGLLDELVEVSLARPSPAVPSHLWRTLPYAGMFRLEPASYR